MFNRILLFSFLLPGTVWGEVRAIIDAPSRVNIGDLVVFDSSRAIGDNHLWVVDPNAVGRTIEFDRRLVFAIGTPGNYQFQLIVADTQANIDQATHTVKVGGTAPPSPEPPSPDPPTPIPSTVFEASRKGVITLNDPTTAKALHTALTTRIRGPPSPEEVQSLIVEVLRNRTGESATKDWFSLWRKPVESAIDSLIGKYDYADLLKEVIRGLQTSSESAQAVPSIKMYTNTGCTACLQWKAKEADRLVASGWTIEEVVDKTNPIPYFDIILPNKIIRHQGYLTMATLTQYLENN